MGLEWVVVSLRCDGKISIRKGNPGVRICGLNQTAEMSGAINHPSGKIRAQVRAYSRLFLGWLGMVTHSKGKETLKQSQWKCWLPCLGSERACRTFGGFFISSWALLAK